MLANLSANDFTVKRKYKMAQGNRRPARWWFVLRALRGKYPKRARGNMEYYGSSCQVEN